MSKVVEKCVAKRLIDYLDANGLNVSYQSAYRKLHRTEMALISVLNDIAIALDQKRSVILRLLDLSAAFDTLHFTFTPFSSIWNWWYGIGMVSIVFG